MEVCCQTSFCQNEDGFPKLLRACTVRLGIKSQPEYDGREFVEHGIEKCVVTVYIGSSLHHVEWSVTAAGHRFKDTCQVVARKALKALCQIYEEEVADTPLRFFPPFQRDRPVWMARIRALEGQQLLEDDPTVMYLTAYLLTLDAQYDFLARHHRQMIARAEDAEKRNRQLHVDLTAQARVAALQSREAIAVEALKQAKDEHVQKLMEVYLVKHNQRRALWIQEPASSNLVQPMRAEDPQILEGHLVPIRGDKKAWELPEGAIVLERIPVFPQAMNKQEHPESLQDPPPELFELLTMKKIPALSHEIKEEVARTPPAPPPSEELQEPVALEEEFDPVLPFQSMPEEVINISSLLTHPGDVSD
jgi:hypothetical protein